MLPSMNEAPDEARSAPSGNPYAPPHAAEGGHGEARSAPYARVAAFATVLGACLGGFLGIAQTIQYGWSLTRFGGLEYVPKVIVLSTSRALGPGAALLVTTVSASVVLHRAGVLARSRLRVTRDARTLWLGAGTMAAFVAVCICTTLAGAATAALVFEMRASAFLSHGLAILSRGDAVRGLVLSGLHGVLATALVPLAAGWLSAPQRRLVLKLFVAYVAVQGTTILEQTVLAQLGWLQG